MSDGRSLPVEVPPPSSPRKYWTRKGIAHWLAECLRKDIPTIVGIDHGFSFPLRYFETFRVEPNWPCFLDDFQCHWPTDGDHIYVDFVRDGAVGQGDKRLGKSRWRRLTEERVGTAKSVFHFNVQGSVAKSTHAGIPWLRFLRRELSSRVHFWPFDGWSIPEGRSVIAEVYPRLWHDRFPRQDKTPDQHDAYCVAAWMAHSDMNKSLMSYLLPNLTANEQTTAQIEGWILGVPGQSYKTARASTARIT